MKFNKLGDSEIEVSHVCLGTMTWGEQNSEQEAFDQIDAALAHGVNFLDAAEAYPVPMKQETSGDTERIIGNWFGKTGRRQDIILATKVVGRSDNTWIRDGEQPRLSRAQIELAINRSLKRLKTDYVDLYQVHWPDRRIMLFGEGNGSYAHRKEDDSIDIHETLEALGGLVKSGKVRTIGVSNETPWGVSRYLRAAEQHDLPKVVSIQNSYSLINRIFEGGLSEFSHRENIGLLAYSPLGMGALSGKYVEGDRPKGSRMDLFPDFMTRYQKDVTKQAIGRYVELARRHDMTPTQLALGFVNSRPFVTSNIIGATSVAQLEEDIAGAGARIGETLLQEINAIHALCKNPAAA